jgi:hypothetical protein
MTTTTEYLWTEVDSNSGYPVGSECVWSVTEPSGTSLTHWVTSGESREVEGEWEGCFTCKGLGGWDCCGGVGKVFVEN